MYICPLHIVFDSMVHWCLGLNAQYIGIWEMRIYSVYIGELCVCVLYILLQFNACTRAFFFIIIIHFVLMYVLFYFDWTIVGKISSVTSFCFHNMYLPRYILNILCFSRIGHFFFIEIFNVDKRSSRLNLYYVENLCLCIILFDNLWSCKCIIIFYENVFYRSVGQFNCIVHYINFLRISRMCAEIIHL